MPTLYDAANQPIAETSDQRSIGDLVIRCREAAGRMSAANDHRRLLLECVDALIDIALQLHNAKKVDS